HRIQAVRMLIHRQKAPRVASLAPYNRRLLACLVSRYEVAPLTLLLYHQCPRRWQAPWERSWPPYFPSMGRRWLLESLSPDTTLVRLHSMGPLPLSSLALHESPRTFGFGNLLPNVGEHPRTFPNSLRRKEAEAGNTGCMHPDTRTFTPHFLTTRAVHA